MGQEFDPGSHLQHSQWIFSRLNCSEPTDNIRQLNVGLQNTSPSVFPFANQYVCAFSANTSIPITEFQADKSLVETSALASSSFPSYGASVFDNSNKKFLVFDQTGGQVNLMPSSMGIPYMNALNQCNLAGIPYVYPNSVNPGFNLQNYNAANASNGHVGDETHENTEEIDALLYSDSDEYDDEASTGHSPVETIAPCSSEVASSLLPAKRKRVDTDDPDTSVIDTASSTISSHPEIFVNYNHSAENGLDCVSSCIKGGNYNQNVSRKRLRRARIQETVSVLRRIIPGGRGKDTATILDEAIRYLKTLQVKAKARGTIPV